jgi:hypothetical protein
MNTAAALPPRGRSVDLELHAYPTIRVDGRRVDLPLKAASR